MSSYKGVEWCIDYVQKIGGYPVQEAIDEITQLRQKVEELESKEFWSNWVYPDGASPEQIQNELADYHFLMEQVPKVYMAVTGSKLSKTNYYAETVITEFESYLQDCIDRELEDAKEEDDKSEDIEE